ncbi:MAG TPA: AAA family ATPase [Candidatus Acidoferrales bacterium]|jgi:type II secretory pathway predicted ATPase ExeA|nr:AAA family ATPase [Candidatus Acidoferrales bacterium]
MHWLTTGMETNIAYGSCTLLFGLLVLSVRSRKMSKDNSYLLYASPKPSHGKAATNPKSEKMVRRILAPTHTSSSAILAKSKVQAASSTKPVTSTSEEAVVPPPVPARAPVPAEIPEPQISDEVKMNAPSFPFKRLDPVAMSNLSSFVTSSDIPGAQNPDVSPMVAYGVVEPEEPCARTSQMDAASDTQMELSKYSATAMHPNDEFLKPSVSLELVPYPLIERQHTSTEKNEGATLLSFFGLTQQPFDVTPDPACLYLSSSHSEALASLQQGIEHCRGFMMLIAEPGMGKTTLLHKLMEEQTESARVVFLFQTQCNSRELLCYILNELEVDHTGMDAVAMHRALNQALLEEMLRGRRFVLIVDEAQNLQEPVLETIRLLSDFETTHCKLIQIVLAGQPQLAETLMRDSLVQLRQRISALSSLKALSVSETAEYVEYRLRAAGWNGRELFKPEALVALAQSSGGVPRSINNYCFAALLKAFHRMQNVVDAELVKEVTGTLNLGSLVRRPQSAPVLPQVVTTVETAVVEAIAPAVVDIPTSVELDQAAAAPFIGPLPNPEIILAGNLTEKVRSQGWSKRHEYRILVTLERDLVSGIPVADRYYCCSIYVDEAQAAMLKPGKPVRIKIEQD